VRSFEDIGGCNKAKDAIKEVIEYMKNPKLFMDAGVRMPKGLLLYGPPGTGKTLIAKAAAAEAQIPVIYTSGSEFVEIYVGVGAKRIREVFKQAREIGPCMIFIDEIDAIGYSRGNNNFIAGGGHRELETTLNQLLNEMDGFEENDRIIVVAATNLASTLDPALLRPGRFDRKIEISLPNPKDRLDILKIHLKNVSSFTKEYDCRKHMKFQTNTCRLLLIRLKDWQGQSLKI
jgi:ATP-dependent Zn protease